MGSKSCFTLYRTSNNQMLKYNISKRKHAGYENNQPIDFAPYLSLRPMRQYTISIITKANNEYNCNNNSNKKTLLCDCIVCSFLLTI